MNVFFTKTWGFGEPSGPLQFQHEGNRTSAFSMLQEGDLVAIVATQGKEVIDPELRGKILGLMEITLQKVSSLDYEIPKRTQDLNEQGEYRWPYGLAISKAWKLVQPVSFKEIAQNKYTMEGVLGIHELTSAEAKAVLALPKTEVALLPHSFRFNVKASEKKAMQRAIPPSTTKRDGIMHMRRAPAHTYLMKLNGSKPAAYKVGWAFDADKRARVFNHHSLPKYGGIEYQVILKQVWPSAYEAFRMEQTLLTRLTQNRSDINSEIITGIGFDKLERLWISQLSKKYSQ